MSASLLSAWHRQPRGHGCHTSLLPLCSLSAPGFSCPVCWPLGPEYHFFSSGPYGRRQVCALQPNIHSVTASAG